jgi:V8-like Glu-specific endopeptidase
MWEKNQDLNPHRATATHANVFGNLLKKNTLIKAAHLLAKPPHGIGFAIVHN